MTAPQGWRQPKCPRCFVEIPPNVFAWTERDDDSLVPDEIASKYSGYPVSGPTVHTAEQPQPTPPGWSPLPADVRYDEVQEACPTCHYPLPLNWRSGQSTCVAMAGARYTGKTVYLAVLVKQLQRLAEQFNREVQPADETTAEHYRDLYETPLFIERDIVQATPSAATNEHNQPLIFSLGHWNGVVHYLVLRDVAGEDLEHPQRVNPLLLDFFQRADAVFFLFDPLRVEEVADQLQDLIPIPEELGGDPREVLRTVISLLRNSDPRVAVIISKFDALQQLAEVQNTEWNKVMALPGAAFNRDPGLISRRYDDMDGRLLDAEVRSLLTKLGAGPQIRQLYNQSTGQAYDHRLFAVSALGKSPAGKQLHPNGISPFRCTDPVRWLYADRGVFTDPPQAQ